MAMTTSIPSFYIYAYKVVYELANSTPRVGGRDCLAEHQSSCRLVWVLCDFHIVFIFGPLLCDFQILSFLGRFPAVDHCTELTVVQPENDETYQTAGTFCQCKGIFVIIKKWKSVIVAKLYDSYLSSPLESNFVNAS